MKFIGIDNYTRLFQDTYFFAVAVEYLSVCFNVRPKRRDSFLPSGCIAESEGSGYSRFPRAVLSAVPHVYSGVFHGVEMADESAGRVAQHAAFSCWASHLRLGSMKVKQPWYLLSLSACGLLWRQTL